MRTLAALALLVLPAVASAQTSFPMVTHVTPVAVQRGTTAEVVVACRTSSLAGAYKVMFEGTGVSAAILPNKETPKVDPKSPVPIVAAVTLKVTVERDAHPGVREFRIATRHGVSSLGQLVVVDAPVVLETVGSNAAAKAQAVPVPCVACGRIEAVENVDYYRFSAKGGQVLSFEVTCARIQDKIHDLQKHADPLVAVFDDAGKELAATDDGFFADPVLTFTAPRDGEYRVAVRDAKFDGDPRWAYALTITDQPYAAQSFPLAVGVGQTVGAEPVGSAAKQGSTWSITAPTTPGIHTAPLKLNQSETNPVPLIATELPIVAETEPNDMPSAATRLNLPGGVNGRIGQRRDLDHFAFTAVKGNAIQLTVHARRFGTVLRSRLDSQLDVMTPDGRVLASNDDQSPAMKDSALVFTPPADGEFVVRVRDLNNKGGEGFIYFLECTAARPDFALKCDPSKAMIGPGSRTAWYVQVARTNGFAGPVKVEVKGLPKGVSVNSLTIPAGMTQGLLVVSAAEDAAIDAAVVEVVGSAEIAFDGKTETITREAVTVEEIYLPGGGRGRFDAGMQAVAVTTQSDLVQVKVNKNRITLKPGEEVKIDVSLLRSPRYDGGVTLDVLLRHLGGVHGNPLPPGVTMLDGKSKTLVGTGTAGHVVLKAAPDAAECTDVPVCVQAFVAINFVVKIGYASEVIWLSVKKK